MPPWRRYSSSRGGVEPDARAELGRVGSHSHHGRLCVLQGEDRELLPPGEAERLARVAGEELQRQDPYHQQVRAMDSLVALGDYRFDAEQQREGVSEAPANEGLPDPSIFLLGFA
jgi:hypothetical protein